MSATAAKRKSLSTHGVGGDDSLVAERVERALEHTTSACRPLIVEFVGLAGVGKSTIAKSCQALATSLGYTICSHRDVNHLFESKSTVQKAFALLRAPLLWRLLYLTLRWSPLKRRPNESFWNHRWRCVVGTRMYFVMLYEFARINPNSVLVLDEWTLQRLNIEDGQCLAVILSFIVRLDSYFEKYYLHLDVPVEVATDRVWRRAWRREMGQESGWKRDDLLDKSIVYQSYAKKYAFYERLYSLCQAHGMKVYKLDGESLAEENAKHIIDRIIEPYLTRCRGAILRIKENSDGEKRHPSSHDAGHARSHSRPFNGDGPSRDGSAHRQTMPIAAVRSDGTSPSAATPVVRCFGVPTPANKTTFAKGTW